MHDCLVTVQVWNKLIQRAEFHVEQLYKTSDETEKAQRLKTVLSTGLSKIGELLNDGNFHFDKFISIKSTQKKKTIYKTNQE